MEFIIKIIKKHSFSIVILAIFLAIAGSIAFFGNFGDEQENFVAGWLITKGLTPYKGNTWILFYNMDNFTCLYR